MEKVKNKLTQFLYSAYEDSDDSDSECEEPLNPNVNGTTNQRSNINEMYNNVPLFTRRDEQNENIAQRIRQSQSTRSISENQSLLAPNQPLIVHRRKSSIALTR